MIRENIRVAVIHGPGNSLRPVWFDWRSRKHTVTAITYHWRQKSGERMLLHYAVAADGSLYELVYNTGEQLWLLESIEAERA